MSAPGGVVSALRTAGVDFVVHTHPPIRTEADLHLTGLDLSASVKTLAFGLPDGGLVLVGMPGLWRVRYAAIAAALGVSRSQLRPAGPDRLAAVGMLPGGVSPICADPATVVLLDASLPGSGRVYCGGGSPDTTIELDVDDILRVAVAPLVAPVAEPQDAR